MAITVPSGSTTNNTRVEQRDYANNKYQEWSFTKVETDSNGIDWYTIKANHADKVLDIENQSTSSSAYLVINTLSGGTTQQFCFNSFSS